MPKRKCFSRYILLFLIFGINNITTLEAQSEDFQVWNFISLSKKIDTKTTASLVSIHRFADNSTRFNDISFDWRISRQLKGNFHAQIAFRNWVFTERVPIYFLWYDLKHVQNKSTYKWVNLLRLHHGLNWNENNIADFIRWRNFYFQKIASSKFVPYVGYDLWFRFNGINDFQSLWLEAGSEYQLEKMKLKLNYRRIGYFKDFPGLRRHIIVASIYYKF